MLVNFKVSELVKLFYLHADMLLLWIFWIPRFSFNFLWEFRGGYCFIISHGCFAYCWFSPSIFGVWCFADFCCCCFFLWSMINTTGMPNGLYIHWKLIIENLYSTSLFSVGETWRVIKQVQVSELNISTCRRGIKSAFKTHWHISGSAIKRCALLGLNALSQG